MKCRLNCFILAIYLAIIPFSLLYSNDYDKLRFQSQAVTITHYHDILKSFSGKYRLIYFFTPPQAKHEKGSGSSTNSIILDERYLEMDSELKFGNDIISRKIIIGYDGILQKFQLTQYSNTETFPIEADGVYDADNKSLVFKGKYPHPEINSSDFEFVIKFDSPDEFTITFFEEDGKSKQKILEIKNYKLSD